jgi:hypothetical protein
VDAERFARRLRFGLKLPQQRGADPAVAGVRQQRDVDVRISSVQRET